MRPNFAQCYHQSIPTPAGSAGQANSLKVALCVAVLLRFFYTAAGALLSFKLHLDPAMVRSNHFTEHLIPQSDVLRYAFLGVWERFDTLWYMHIAQFGYDRPETVVFPPLYPWLIRFVTFITGAPLIAALLVSTVSAFLLFWGFHRLASLDVPQEVASRATLLYAIWPASFILFAGYPDSLVIALMLWALVFGRSQRWWLAGLAGLLASLAKAVGFLVVVPLLVMAWRKRSWRAAPVLLSGTGYFLYVAWLYASHRMLPTESYATFWRTTVAPPWETLAFTLQNALAGNTVLRLHVFLLIAITFAALWKRIRPEYVFYVLVALAFLLTKKSDPSQQQLTRYLLILFPAPLNVALSMKDGGFAVVALVALVVNLLFFWSFLNWWLVA